MNTLEDKVAVVTGAASGIGGAIAQSLADSGAHIVAVDIKKCVRPGNDGEHSSD
jgi:NAD(P)-dependent dehydrogenase (short-subunit alcohol dehydrogenase family)